MELLLTLLNKVLVVLFFMACLNVFRHAYYLIGTSLDSTPENPRKYILSNKGLIYLGFSISYMLSVVITGLQI